MSAQPTAIKAIAYVVNKDEFVVFIYTNFSEASVQVSSSTVEKLSSYLKLFHKIKNSSGSVNN
jgi:hypothetical protein